LIRRLAVLFSVLFITAGCSNALRWTPDYHTVRSGETVYTIAMRYDLDTRDISAWNSLGDGTFIRAGQKLRLKPGSGSSSRRASSSTSSTGSTARKQSRTLPTLPAPAWRWPATGKVLYRFGKSSKSQSGIRIGGVDGAPVIATAGGEVVYAGTGLKSYGQLVIIKHNDTWLSAYGFNKALLVSEGGKVAAGQKIATMGKTSKGKTMLHFEIRRNGQPVDPQKYLSKRN
jgi:lipoprotein NlpD